MVVVVELISVNVTVAGPAAVSVYGPVLLAKYVVITIILTTLTVKVSAIKNCSPALLRSALSTKFVNGLVGSKEGLYK